jgi:hypothetical protein
VSEPKVNKAGWILLSLCCLFPSCGGIDVTSTYRDRNIVIDADGKEWAGLSLYTDKKVSFAVCNDSTYLYMLLTTSDPSLQRQFSRMGLNLWFDATGGSDKTFGIHYPTRRPGDRMPPMPGQEGGMDSAPQESPQMTETAANEMEILGKDDEDRMIVPLAEAKDLQLKMSSSSGQLVFELRVPLVRDPQHPHGIGASLASAVGLGIETPKFDFKGTRERMEGGNQPPGGQGGGMPPGGEGRMPRGGAMGGGRGRGGSGGRAGAGQGRSAPESISVWATVKLASK